jgi:hypothetical protein
MQVHAAYQESFFRKFLFIALICFAYALWCLYDGLVAYPAKLERAQVYHGEMLEMAEGREAAWLERTQTEGWPIHIPDKPEKIESDITTQFVQIGIVLAIGIPMLLKYLLARGTYVAADDQAIRPSWRREAIPFAAITKIDKTRWESKGIAKLTYTTEKGQKSFVMDDFKFARAEMGQIMARAERDLPETAVIRPRQATESNSDSA